jgi:hypothetical protein
MFFVQKNATTHENNSFQKTKKMCLLAFEPWTFRSATLGLFPKNKMRLTNAFIQSEA